MGLPEADAKRVLNLPLEAWQNPQTASLLTNIIKNKAQNPGQDELSQSSNAFNTYLGSIENGVGWADLSGGAGRPVSDLFNPVQNVGAGNVAQAATLGLGAAPALLAGVGGGAAGVGAAVVASVPAGSVGGGGAAGAAGADLAAEAPIQLGGPAGVGSSEATDAAFGGPGGTEVTTVGGADPGMAGSAGTPGVAGTAASGVAGDAATGGALAALLRGVPGILGAIGANQQTHALEGLARDQMAMGAPYRDRLAALYANPDSFLTSKEVTTPVQQGTDALARSLSVQGNPIGSGHALQELQDYSANQLFGKLGQEKDRLAGFGGLSAYNAAAPGTASAAIGSQGNVYNGIGAAAGAIFNPQPTLIDLYKSMKGIA
jgi:hypothetical protein